MSVSLVTSKGRRLISSFRSGFRIILFSFLSGWLLSASANAGENRGVSINSRKHLIVSTCTPVETGLYSASYALVIGINAYDHGWLPLTNAVRDASKVSTALANQGFEVDFRQNLNAAELKDVFEKFFSINGSDAQARLFIWFAGHGHTIGEEGYLVPTDAPPKEKIGRFKYKALSLRRFGEYARQADAKHILAVFDSCFAGTIFHLQKSETLPDALTNAVNMPVRQYISSGDRLQQVPDNGLFCRLFLRALEGRENSDYNGDGYLTGSELGMYLYKEITNRKGSLQTPKLGKLFDYKEGDFVFTLQRDAVVPAAPAPCMQSEEDTMPVEQIAIFPSQFKSTQRGGLQKQQMIEAVTASLRTQHSVGRRVTVYSHYALDSTSSPKPFPSGLITSSDMKKIWTKPNLFASPQPNTELISKIALKLDIAAVLLYQIVDQAGEDVVKVWLVDVEQRKKYSAEDNRNFNSLREELDFILQTLNSQVWADFQSSHAQQ